jgi:protoporphyrinogen oxidase
MERSKMRRKTAAIIGAGPAGLTAAYELLRRTDVKPIIYESTADIGGISKTVHYKGNRIDIGGHRFFSKSDRVMEWAGLSSHSKHLRACPWQRSNRQFQ